MKALPMILALALALPPLAAAQMDRPPGMEGGRPGGPPAFLDEVFPPSLVMRNQAEIGLTGEQRDAITKAMADTQTKLVELQWRSEAESEKLNTILAKTTVDEAAALAQSETVLRVEQEIKQTHLALLVRIKNELTPAQQKQLRALRVKWRGRHHGPPD